MLGFLKRFLASVSQPRLVVRGYWCDTLVRLPVKIRTPLGGTVSVLRVCVDVYYHIVSGQEIVVDRVRLSRSVSDWNVAADRRGEAWYAPSLSPEWCLEEAVRKDLSRKDARLRKIMFGKWRDANRRRNL